MKSKFTISAALAVAVFALSNIQASEIAHEQAIVSPCGLSTLPNEVLLDIAELLPSRSLISLSETSKGFKELLKNLLKVREEEQVGLFEKSINQGPLNVTIDLFSKKIDYIFSKVFESKNLVSLDSLYLSSSQLTSLPASIGSLKNLGNLDLAGSKLTSLPASIGSLKNLWHLDLSGNMLTSLPASIGSLKNLLNLYLSGNMLASLPASIGSLKNLKKLYLNDNKLTSLPASIGSLENLECLDLSRNKLNVKEKAKIKGMLPIINIEF